MPPRLSSLDLRGIADYIKSGSCKRVVLLTGAGMSTAAGIPDFRSPGGMYDSLRPDLLTATEKQRMLLKQDPTWVVMKDMFFQNAFPYLEVRRPFILGTQEKKWKATLSHWFVKFLEEEGILLRLYTQNIDGLDYQTGVDSGRICNVHGSIATVSCESCQAPADFGEFCRSVRENIKDIYGIDSTAPVNSTSIACAKCGRPTVKPDTVLFGSSLPRRFFTLADQDLHTADLLIVLGSSLVVSPANTVVMRVSEDCPRLIVNKEKVGEDLDIRYGPRAIRDVFCPQACDEGLFELIELLGWQEKVRSVLSQLPEQSASLVSARL
eukprot:gnl/MRDRNA2_/MRDRNA2_70723_c0_seq1.p1 gnl/MRDRNA2_/MRDRNA2_70723_c0~~gnl/MRDRNA2_/MRDRNA2_70723_c0_seq1.p1  ORF type:complete len:323 (-),score=47.15 gnl/MRDRNA2_/MRDRNA2_70723_c0_seq1:87-1055(-)